MIDLLAEAVAELAGMYPGVNSRRRPNGSHVVTVPNVALGPGWVRPRVTVEFELAPAYPAAQPDCFFADSELRLAGGGMPQNSKVRALDGDPRLWFSWHLSSWRPGVDDLVTYMRFIERRLRHAR